MKKKGEGDKESERFAGKKETKLRNEEVKSKERKENGYELEGDGGLSKNRPRRTDKKGLLRVLDPLLPSAHLCCLPGSNDYLRMLRLPVSDVASLILEPAQAIF
ncbi:hypothetical protein NC652_008445 [Populus alba x Populus x berolinensis]|uniref:Uncharacterized protein n=1 Tax=Populus alba x Populus x berolinensis TaxID=444605 RepID=A0AAD6R7R5_9ROSI|nr:hypothetical protein NC652_008445 [Populus alba x Populus x berolinensis]KAJ7003252.1 hypothetical protein NC653_008483 [Populus alba x Populus x berolinensis]